MSGLYITSDRMTEHLFANKGSTQITSVDQLGRNYVATVNKGDLWYFPPGIPHSLQATNDDPDGTEFLLVRLIFVSLYYRH